MSGFASWFGKRPSISKHSRVVWHGSRSNSCGATSPPMPLPASSTTLNGLMIDGIDEAHHVLDVARRAHPVRDRPRTRRRRRHLAAAIMSRMSEMPSSPLSGNASRRTIFMPLYCFGLCEAVTITPPSWPSAGDREVEHVGRDHAVVDDVGALRGRAVDERRRDRRGREPHVAADGDALGLQVGDERGADGAGRLFVHLIGIGAANVVGLEDVGVERKWTWTLLRD